MTSEPSLTPLPVTARAIVSPGLTDTLAAVALFPAAAPLVLSTLTVSDVAAPFFQSVIVNGPRPRGQPELHWR